MPGSAARLAVVLSLSALLAHPHAAAAQGTSAPQSGDAAGAAASADAYYQYLLARHYENEGDIALATEAYEKARSLDPDSAQIPAEMAAMYWRQNDLRKARETAEAALKIDAANVDAHRVLGGIYASLADPEERTSSTGGGAAGPQEAARLAIDHLQKAHRPDGTDRDAGLDLTLARLYMQVGEQQQAVDLLNRVIEYEPDVGESYVMLARAETAVGHPERAIAAIEQASQTNPRLLATLAGLYENQRQWGAAARTYEALSRYNPTSTDIKTRWASALLQVNDGDSATRARDLLVQVTQATPTDPRPLYLLSAAERQRHDYPAAEAAARRLMALAPDSSTGSFALAQVYEDQHLYGKAADALQPAVARLESAGGADGASRDLLTMLAHLGYAQLQAGRGDDAVETFQPAGRLSGGSAFETSLIQAYMTAKKYDQAAAIAHAAGLRQPDQPRFAQLEARALVQAGKKDRAVTIMKDAAQANPGDVGTRLALVQTLEDAGRPGEADQALTAAGEQFPSDVRVPFQRGALLEQRKDYAGAEAAFRSALAQDPDHAPTLNYLGYMLAERGQHLDEAVSLVERALKLDPDNASYLDSLGWAYVQQKKYGDAEPLLRRAAAQMPSNSVVQEHLGDLLFATGRSQDAVAAWRRALDGDREDLDVKSVERKIQKAK